MASSIPEEVHLVCGGLVGVAVLRPALHQELVVTVLVNVARHLNHLVIHSSDSGASTTESFGCTYNHQIRGPHHQNHLVVHSSDTGTSPSELFGYTFI